MILGIDPKVDYAFKHLFGRDSTRPILINVINSVLNRTPDRRVRELELVNPFNPKEALDDKLSILDIKARDQSGRQFNVEMQMLMFRHYEKRILYYGSKLHQQQLQEGQNYAQLRPTISISFLDHVLFPEVSDYHLRFRLLEETHHFPLTEDMEYHLFELPKFRKSSSELQSELDVWLYFLRHAAMIDTEAVPNELKQPLVVRALEELKMLGHTDLERERYEARRKFQLDYNTAMLTAREDGLEEGLEEGRKEGIKEGIEKAGRDEKTAMIHFCERLLHRPLTPLEQLAGLSLVELARCLTDLQSQLMKPE